MQTIEMTPAAAPVQRNPLLDWVADVRLAYLSSVGVTAANFVTLIIYGLQNRFHYAAASAGFVGSADLTGIAVGAMIVALFPRRLGSGRWVAIGFVIAGVADLVSPVLADLWPLVVVRCVHGLAGGATLAILGAAMGRTKASERVIGAAIVIQLTQSALAIILLPPLIQRFGVSAVYLPMAAIAGLGLLLLPSERRRTIDHVHVSRQLKAPRSSEATSPLLLFAAAILGLFLFQGSRFMTAGYSFPIGAFYRLDTAFVSEALGISTWLAGLGALAAAVVGSRWGRGWPIIATTVVAAVANAVFIPFGGNRLVFALTNDVVLIAVFFALPYFLGVCIGIDRTGRLAMWSGFISTIGLAVGPAIGGWVLNYFGMMPLLVSSSLLMAASGVVSLLPAAALDREARRTDADGADRTRIARRRNGRQPTEATSPPSQRSSPSGPSS